jgi:hypothetical protein
VIMFVFRRQSLIAAICVGMVILAYGAWWYPCRLLISHEVLYFAMIMWLLALYALGMLGLGILLVIAVILSRRGLQVKTVVRIAIVFLILFMALIPLHDRRWFL